MLKFSNNFISEEKMKKIAKLSSALMLGSMLLPTGCAKEEVKQEAKTFVSPELEGCSCLG